jgi:hypothetical protein
MFGGPIGEQIGLEIGGSRFDLLDRKFEPERLGLELFLRVAVDRFDIGPGGLVQMGVSGPPEC